MTLTQSTNDVNLSLHCNSGVEFCSSFRLGDNPPQFKAVFLRLPVFNFRRFMEVHIIMVVLFEQSLRLVAPSRDTANSLNAATNVLQFCVTVLPTLDLVSPA
jgi:hypothetical protein